MKRMLQMFRTSVTMKSLAFLIMLTTGILVCTEVVTFMNIRHFEQSTLDNYHESVKNYYAYWDEKFDVINSSIVQLTSVNNDNMLYWNICNSKKTLEFETSKIMFVRNISDIARNHLNEILIFCYVPERNVYLKSTNHLVAMEERGRTDQDILDFIEQTKQYNSTEWRYFESENHSYLINVFTVYGGYIGALVPCETVLYGLMQEDGIVCETVLIDEDGNEIYVEKDDSGNVEGVYTFDIPMRHLKYNMQVNILRKNVFTERSNILMLSLATFVVGIMLLVGNIIFQMKFVLGPLNTLRKAMEQFSQGNFDTCLPVNNRNNEINVLFRTFNEMIGQIDNLKIEVYESRLERERIQSNYMRVQIQPHFYTNILNLIYSLAQIGEYQAIQKLTKTTGSYFRYLLGEKGTFVKLYEELRCVESYIEIQKMRYGDCLDFSVQVYEGLENQMVLPMVLQTFVENCIKHNITLVPLLKVQIRITANDEMLCFIIEDNGVGFEAGMLERINAGENISEDGKHIGINNVKERMKLFYGENAQVIIQSEGGRTVVKIVFQKIGGKET